MNADPSTPSPGASPAPPPLELIDAEVPRFDGTGPPVLSGVNWRIAAGEFHVIGGLPASGKTALLAAAAGVLRVETGELRLFGESLRGLPEAALVKVRRRVGLVFADGGRLFHQLTVAENIALPLRYHRDRDEEAVVEAVNRLLEATGLTRVAAATPGRLGRHQHPRAALARALALDPELLLLDHPLAGLDPREVRWWLGFLQGLAEGHALLGGRPLTIAVATHHLRPGLRAGRRFFCAQEGRFSEAGGSEAVCASENAVLRELLADG